MIFWARIKENMKTIAIITARGGSKRIPRKNIKNFLGKPIIAYSIKAALDSKIFDEVMVSTDDIEIAEIAKRNGANVPFLRSEKTSNDYATTSDVLFEVIDEYEKRGQKFDVAACIYPTAPFITGDKLKSAFDKLIEGNADTVIPVVEFSYPIQRAFVIDDEKLKFENTKYISARSQDLEKHYHDAGQFYIFNIDAYKKSGNLLSGNIAPIIVNELEVQDIDNMTDWKIAELKYKLMIESQN